MIDDKENLWRMLAGLEGKCDVDGSLDLLSNSTLSEDPRGQRYIGWIYTTRNDFVVAGSWYLKAAQQGDDEALADCMECAIAMWRSGFREESLSLTASPPLSSLETFQRFSVSRYFDLGNGEKLLEWSARLAEFGREEDVMYVARLLLSQGNAEAAAPYLEVAAERGSPAAHQLIGELYRRGAGVLQDDAKANLHFREGAKHGYILSQTRLLHSESAMRGAWYLPIFVGRLLALMAKTVALNSIYPGDPRLADLPQCGPRKGR